MSEKINSAQAQRNEDMDGSLIDVFWEKRVLETTRGLGRLSEEKDGAVNR